MVASYPSAGLPPCGGMNERSRALVWAGGLLIELARDKGLPLDLRRRAVSIARHFPTIEEVDAMAIFDQSYGLGLPSKQAVLGGFPPNPWGHPDFIRPVPSKARRGIE